jgi:hypothetical protein
VAQLYPRALGSLFVASYDSQGLRSLFWFEVEVNLRPTVSRPACPGVRRPSGTRDQFFFLLEIYFRQLRVYYFVAPSLTRGRVRNLLYNCFWALPEQSLLGRSPAELTEHLRLPHPGVGVGVGVGVRHAADGQSTNSSLVSSIP